MSALKKKQFLSYGINSFLDVISTKFVKDVTWNIISFIILGISGILLNFIIGRFYSASTLGVFNQVFALYIFLSQFGALGIYFSVLKYVSEFSENHELSISIIISGLIISSISSSIITLIVYIFAKNIGSFFESSLLSMALIYVLPGLWSSALNKVLLAALNGFRYMKVYAIAQAIRYILMIGALVFCLMINVQGYVLPVIITMSDLGLLLFLLIYIFSKYKFEIMKIKKNIFAWLPKHLHFGLKGFLSGTIAELNTRIDVLMLGYFLTDKNVGIYSMAAFIVEGLMMLSFVIRDNINPLITKYIMQKRYTELSKMVRLTLKIWYSIMFLIGGIAIITYPYFIRLIVNNKEFIQGWSSFNILILGCVLSAGYLPFNMILVQSGFPGIHTFLKIITILTNIILNAVLIPIAGINGAAIATAATFVLSICYLKQLVKKYLNFRL